MDKLGTKKSKNDIFATMCQKILNETEKLKEGFVSENTTYLPTGNVSQVDEDLIIYDPHYKTGVISGYKETTEH